MKCPRCGNEMDLDGHRKYSLQMCYKCGYIEGRNVEESAAEEAGKKTSNFEHLKELDLNELAAFMAVGLDIDEAVILRWLMEYE